jgi:small subunit ribosomal protein S16
MGKKKMPFYRVVVIDQKKRRDGAYIESLGFYDPLRDPTLTRVDVDKAVDWLLKGAQPTETVRSLFRKHGVMDRFTKAKNGEAAVQKEEDGAVEEE